MQSDLSFAAMSDDAKILFQLRTGEFHACNAVRQRVAMSPKVFAIPIEESNELRASLPPTATLRRNPARKLFTDRVLNVHVCSNPAKLKLLT